MKHRLAAGAAVLLALGVGAVTAPGAQAASFCSSRISGSTYYQKSFTHNGHVVATLCAPGSNRAGNATLYARGDYRYVQKYMKITTTTRTATSTYTRSADGRFYSYVYRYNGAGLHSFHAVMYDGHGHRIVNGYGADFD